MHCRPQIRCFAAWFLVLANAFLPAAAQPNRDKNTWTYDGGIFLETRRSDSRWRVFSREGPCDGRRFFRNLRREDTNSGTLFRRGNDIVTEFPKRLHLSMSIADIPCDPHMQQANSRVYLTDEMIRSLRAALFLETRAGSPAGPRKLSRPAARCARCRGTRTAWSRSCRSDLSGWWSLTCRAKACR